MVYILSLSIVSLIPGCSLSISSYKAPFRLSDTSASVPRFWLFWGLVFGSFFVKDLLQINRDIDWQGY